MGISTKNDDARQKIMGIMHKYAFNSVSRMWVRCKGEQNSQATENVKRRTNYCANETLIPCRV